MKIPELHDATSKLQRLVGEAATIVPFTGAGISTECGIPDFRSPGGLWTKNRPIPFDEFLASQEARNESWRDADLPPPKSRSGNRRVPITQALRRELLNHRLQQGRGGRGFVFPNKQGNRPFNPGTLKLHTTKAWTVAGLAPIGLHECRHSTPLT